jgi:RNA recognition motif-containing protein
LCLSFFFFFLIIFANSCEIIRDKKTNDSLSYAFIEFAEKQQAEEAYFKMNNVLIDDRRIHVDFSQSVSKLHQDFMGMKNISFLNFHAMVILTYLSL